MAEESQEKSTVETGLDNVAEQTGGFDTKSHGRRGGSRVKIKDLTFCKAVISLAMEGFTARGIATQLKTSQDTIRYILDAARIDDLRKLVVAKMARQMVDVQEMVFSETLEKRDRRLGHEMLTESGWYEGLRDKSAQSNEGKGITFEFNFPPPPWAPHAIAHAPQTPQAQPKVIESKNEDQPKLRAKPASVDVPTRD